MACLGRASYGQKYTTTRDIAVDLADDTQAKDKSGIGRFLDRVKGDGTGLEVRDTPADASLADLFLGETDNNKNLVDLSRLQNGVRIARARYAPAT